MSWPTDGRPRFVVGTVEGALTIGGGGTSRPLGTSWLVFDRADLHACVAEYRSESNAPGLGGGSRAMRQAHWERTAHEHAARLNAEHEQARGEAVGTSTGTGNELAERFGEWAKGWGGKPR